MKKKRGIPVWVFLLSLILTVVATCGGILALAHPTNRLLASWQSPDRMYDGTYTLQVDEGELDFSTLENLHRDHFLILGIASQGRVTYGHVIDYSFSPDIKDYDNLPSHLQKCTVTWADDGVTLREPDGHALFIPKTMFKAR